MKIDSDKGSYKAFRALEDIIMYYCNDDTVSSVKDDEYNYHIIFNADLEQFYRIRKDVPTKLKTLLSGKIAISFNLLTKIDEVKV